MMYTIILDNQPALVSIYILCLAVAGYLTFRLFSRQKQKMLDEKELIFQLKISRSGHHTISVHKDIDHTVGGAEKVVKQIIKDLVYRDERLVRILFAETFNALLEDPKVRQLYHEATGEELPDNSSKTTSDVL